MNKLLSYIGLISLLGSGIAYSVSPLPVSFRVPPVLVSVGPSRGSGFFFQASNSVYLITARHVLFNDKADRTISTNLSLWGTQAECRAFAGPSNLEPTVMVIDLSLLLSRNEVRYSTNHDVAVVRVEDCHPTNSTWVTLCPGITLRTATHVLSPIPPHFAQRFDDVPVGTDIYLFGFPSSVGLAELPQIDQEQPLLRKGIVAGINRSRRTIILDCPSYQGNSGGPVLTREPQDLINNKFNLIGVLTEWVPFQESWQNSRFGYVNQTLSNSGYSVVEPMDSVFELIWK